MAIKKIGISRSLLIHPGETVADILEERSITQGELASKMGLPMSSVEKLIHGEENISEPLASALERALNIPESFWLNLQTNYERELSELVKNQEGLHSSKRPVSGKRQHLSGKFVVAAGGVGMADG